MANPDFQFKQQVLTLFTESKRQIAAKVKESIIELQELAKKPTKKQEDVEKANFSVTLNLKRMEAFIIKLPFNLTDVFEFLNSLFASFIKGVNLGTDATISVMKILKYDLLWEYKDLLSLENSVTEEQLEQLSDKSTTFVKQLLQFLEKKTEDERIESENVNTLLLETQENEEDEDAFEDEETQKEKAKQKQLEDIRILKERCFLSLFELMVMFSGNYLRMQHPSPSKTIADDAPSSSSSALDWEKYLHIVPFQFLEKSGASFTERRKYFELLWGVLESALEKYTFLVKRQQKKGSKKDKSAEKAGSSAQLEEKKEKMFHNLKQLAFGLLRVLNLPEQLKNVRESKNTERLLPFFLFFLFQNF